MLKDAAEAEDVLTAAFFEIWSRADRFDASRGSPLTYLITLVRSRSIDRQRSIATRRTVTSGDTDSNIPATSAGPLQSLEITEQCKVVRQAMAELDATQREALECSFYDGLSHSEIADKLNKPLGTVKTYIRQGLIR